MPVYMETRNPGRGMTRGSNIRSTGRTAWRGPAGMGYVKVASRSVPDNLSISPMSACSMGCAGPDCKCSIGGPHDRFRPGGMGLFPPETTSDWLVLAALGWIGYRLWKGKSIVPEALETHGRKGAAALRAAHASYTGR